MYEHRRSPLLPRSKFLTRLFGHSFAALALLAGSLYIGMLGYEHFEGMNSVDAFANAAMILGGMGPLAPLQTEGGKLFAGVYAIYCGVVFLVCVSIALAPLVHRLLHRFHLEDVSPERD